MYTIGKSFTFAAAHHLPALPDDHQCRRPHGHNYTVEVALTAAALDAAGFVVDYGLLGAWWREQMASRLDHRDLNTLGLPFSACPSAEAVAQWIYQTLHAWMADRGWRPRLQVTAVRVQETPTTYAEYRP